MRIIQIIDSLEAGGAERMAVSYANALIDKIDFSGLVATRKEGSLRNQLSDKVSYLFLNKKRTTDIKALFRLRNFVVQNKVTHIHAHSTSFFTAFLIKISYPRIKLIWHDHYGDSEFLFKRPALALKIIIPFYKGIIAVNQNLKVWAQRHLYFENVVYLPNFPSVENKVQEYTILKGITGKRILCLANLRAQKNHFLLLEVAKKVKKSHPEWTFHLVGKDFEDNYSHQIKTLIIEFELEDTVFLYGSKQDVKNIMEQVDIGVLSSNSEGLPVALLEYGWYKKAVVVTKVGEIPSLVQDGINGFLVAPNNVNLFFKTLTQLMENNTLQTKLGKALHCTVVEGHSKESVLNQYLNWLKKDSK